MGWHWYGDDRYHPQQQEGIRCYAPVFSEQ